MQSGILNTIRYPDGSIYTGDVTDGIRSGQGTLVLEDGTRYVGTWSEDRLLDGRLSFPNGNWYEGHFLGFEYDGEGEFHWSTGDCYVGCFRGGTFDGTGHLALEDGTVYDGGFKDGSYDGPGRLRKADGRVIAGVFREGCPYEGMSLELVDGRTIEGAFDGWKLSGDIAITYPNGDVYSGGIDDEYNPQGHGQMTAPDGSTRSGSFEHGEIVGKMEKRLRDGTVICGECQNGVFTSDVVVTYTDGGRFYGRVLGDLPSGMGTYIDKLCNRYHGPFEGGKPAGFFEVSACGGSLIKGIMTEIGRMGEAVIEYRDGSRYQGGIVNCLPEGQGSYRGKDGVEYSGEFKEGSFNGQGLLRVLGMTYTGEFRSGEICGRGRYEFSNGTSVEGTFGGSYPREEGVLRWAHGQIGVSRRFDRDITYGRLVIGGLTYQGRFKNSVPFGEGRLEKNGVIYTSGDFNGFEIRGRGKIAFPDGSVFEGTFYALDEANGTITADGRTRGCKIHNGAVVTGLKRYLVGSRSRFAFPALPGVLSLAS